MLEEGKYLFWVSLGNGRSHGTNDIIEYTLKTANKNDDNNFAIENEQDAKDYLIEKCDFIIYKKQ